MFSIKKGVEYLLHNRAQFCDSIVKNFLGFLPDKLYLSLRYRCQMGHWINWKNPKTFTEKLQWLKVYDYKPEYTQMVDKLTAKDYVAERIGQEYIIPTLGVWDRVEDINWDSLPDQFVLKTTHGGGGCGVVVCSNKANFDRTMAIKKLQISMQSNAGKTYREKPYLNVSRKIIAEKFIAVRKPKQNDKVVDMPDYKFFCFNGEPKFLYISNFPNHELVFLNTDWSKVEFERSDYKALTNIPPKPENLDEMLDIARKLSKGKAHVRVDLYNVNKHIYFGALTFYTGAGFISFTPKEYDKVLGEMLKLPSGEVKFYIKNNEITQVEQETPFEDLKDYKFFCFNGKVKCFKIDFGRFVEHHANYYSPEGKLLPFGEKGLEPDPNHIEIMPENLNEMISIAEQLSNGFKFLRVDLYNIKGKIFFGELTFYPAAGMLPFVPEKWDDKLGKYLIIE